MAAQIHKPKPPLDVLQSMVNGILIETGKALRASEKDSGRTFASANTRLKSTIPSAIDNFHQALDELEIDLLRAKAVVLRDLKEKQAERFARENPTVIPEPQVIEEEIIAAALSQEPSPIGIQSTTSPLPLEQNVSPEGGQAAELAPIAQPIAAISIPNPPTTPGIQAADTSQQALTPPDSTAQPASKPVGLGINTEGIPPPINTSAAAEATSTAPVSSVDSLFDIPLDDDDDLGNLDAEPSGSPFLAMDFSTTAENMDLSSFDNNGDTQDFTTDVDANKQLNDMFDVVVADNMDLDVSMDMRMAEESTFDDLLWDGDGDGDGDDRIRGGMETDQFDDAFFGIGS